MKVLQTYCKFIYNAVNLKLSVSQMNKLNPTTKKATDVPLSLSSNTFCNNETNFPRGILLTDSQVASLCKIFANKSSAKINSQRQSCSKITPFGGIPW